MSSTLRGSFLTAHAAEQSTYIVIATFTDEDDVELTPSSITWTLTKVDGTIVNGREDVVITPPASSNDIVLSGADLAILDGKDEEIRELTIEAVYSSSYGSDLPLKYSVQFVVENLAGV